MSVTTQNIFTFKDVPKNRTAKKFTPEKSEEFPLSAKGFTWQKGDHDFRAWRTQGTTGVKEDGKEYVFISWEGRKDDSTRGKSLLIRNDYINRGVRISIVDVTDMDDIKYRHVLLTSKDITTGKYKTFEKAKAGGIMYLNGKLHVTDTADTKDWKIRVFDMNKIIKLPSNEKIHKYEYIMVEEYNYLSPIKPSNMSYDKERKQVLISTFVENPSDNNPSTFTMFAPPMNAAEAQAFNTKIAAKQISTYRLPDKYKELQGIASSTDEFGNQVLWLTSSRGRFNRSSFYELVVKDLNKTEPSSNILYVLERKRKLYPSGLGDLYFSNSNQLWSNTMYGWDEGDYYPLSAPLDGGTESKSRNTRRVVFAINKEDISYTSNEIGTYLTMDKLPLNRKGMIILPEIKKMFSPAHTGFFFDLDDSNTFKWRPQGVAGKTVEGQKFLITSWYGRPKVKKLGVYLSKVSYKDRGARITIANITDICNIKYRHVLLVDKYGTTFYNCHAGGIAIIGNKLHVADNRGTKDNPQKDGTYDKVLVFDLTKIEKIDEPIKKYNYILRLESTYDVPVGPASISYDKNTQKMMAATFTCGKDCSLTAKEATKIAIFDPTNVNHNSPYITLESLETKYNREFREVQGAATTTFEGAEYLVLCSSYMNSTIKEWIYTPSVLHIFEKQNGEWRWLDSREIKSSGLEDIYFSDTNLWTVSEFALAEGGTRAVVSMRISTIIFDAKKAAAIRNSN